MKTIKQERMKLQTFGALGWVKSPQNLRKWSSTSSLTWHGEEEARARSVSAGSGSVRKNVIYSGLISTGWWLQPIRNVEVSAGWSHQPVQTRPLLFSSPSFSPSPSQHLTESSGSSFPWWPRVEVLPIFSSFVGISLIQVHQRFATSSSLVWWSSFFV